MKNTVTTAALTSSAIIELNPSVRRDEDVSLSENAMTVLRARYLKKDDEGVPAEEPHDMFRRVADVVAGAEERFGAPDAAGPLAVLFYNMMARGEFMPNSPTLMNAGRELGQLSACFVLPVEDTMESIFQAVKDAALIHKSGGGTGFAFSRLRPKNDVVRSTRGISSGPVSFMHVFDAATETIKQGGTRRGANMGILRVDHPDIHEFISCKCHTNRFTNFNISVAVTDAFMDALAADGEYDLVNPHTGETVRREKASDIFDLIVENAHACGDPGVVFIDRINEFNPLISLGPMESTNPCGEQPLMPFESCNLGSVNLSLMVREGDGGPDIDWEKLARTVHLGVRFLDNVIEVNRYPLDRIADITHNNRKIGLGVMGFADLLIRLGIPYDSAEAEHLADRIMAFVDSESKAESRHLAGLRGAFPNFPHSIYAERGEAPLRNATTTTVAPTGTISIIASCSSGIEPVFALAYRRNVLDGGGFAEFHPLFRQMATDADILSDDIEREVIETGSVSHIEGIPERFRRIFRTAGDIPVEWHIRIQAAFQRHTDNAVSKTINFPRSATPQDVAAAYRMAWDAGLKGVTIYRDRSRDQQVLSVARPEEAETDERFATAGQSLTPRPRPSVTRGNTEKILTGCGNLYVTVNEDDAGLCEVFCQMGRSGGCTASQSEAISRLISLALRSGITLDSIHDQLEGIRCPSPMWQNGRLILSCADAIATALSRYLDDSGVAESPPAVHERRDRSRQLEPIHLRPESKRGEMAGICPDCGSVLENAEGCAVCRVCGFSRCG